MLFVKKHVKWRVVLFSFLLLLHLDATKIFCLRLEILYQQIKLLAASTFDLFTK